MAVTAFPAWENIGNALEIERRKTRKDQKKEICLLKRNRDDRMGEAMAGLSMGHYTPLNKKKVVSNSQHRPVVTVWHILT